MIINKIGDVALIALFAIIVMKTNSFDFYTIYEVVQQTHGFKESIT